MSFPRCGNKVSTAWKNRSPKPERGGQGGLLEEVVGLFFVADGGGGAMAGVDGEGVGEGGELLQGAVEGGEVAAG